jgi:hypothetical protein
MSDIPPGLTGLFMMGDGAEAGNWNAGICLGINDVATVQLDKLLRFS